MLPPLIPSNVSRFGTSFARGSGPHWIAVTAGWNVSSSMWHGDIRMHLRVVMDRLRLEYLDVHPSPFVFMLDDPPPLWIRLMFDISLPLLPPTPHP
jgi:hypothetical protein